MSIRNRIMLIAVLGSALLLGACSLLPGPNPLSDSPPTPIPTLAPAATPTLVDEIMPVSNSASLPETQPDAAALGAPIYLENCSPCHGVQGEGVDAPALRNNQFIQTGDPQEIYDTVANGRPDTEMPAWLQANGGALTADQITSAIAYVGTLQHVSRMTPQPPEETGSEEAQPTPGGPTPGPARPSIEGDVGAAASLTGDAASGQRIFGLYCAACHGPEGVQGIPNPGSDDGSVPALNPIDYTLVSSDPSTFASNLDLFIEHGSVPEGAGPQIMMPAFGDGGMLTDQQMADVIAYVMSLNDGQ